MFENKTRLYKKDIPTRSVIPGGMMDLDGDLVDDLVILDKGIWLKSVISQGKYFSLKLIDSLRLSQNSEVTLTAGDLNNDGLNEIITSGEYSLINVSTFKDNKTSKKSFQSGIYAQGSNTVDVNNDGWLDYFLANDDGPSRIYINDKTGNLVLTPVIDFMKDDKTDGSGNYGSIWTDVNGDFLPDLCISKCRAGVNDPRDARRVNRLYINKGNSIFEEKGAEYGLNSGEQSWVTTFGDIDNDGDQDAFVVNHYAPHILLENLENMTFKPIPLSKPIQSFGFQAVMSDFDNDGWLDIIIAGVEGATVLHNKGNKKFDILQGVIGPNLARSITVGDINDDGFNDIYAHINEPINDPGLKDDELWVNKGNSNHFLKVNLEGKLSNRSAIGAHLTLYTPGKKQVRYLKGGESYGIFNSLQQQFGLGNTEIIDSLVIRWPSGIIERFGLLKVDRTYFIQEGKCTSEQVALYNDELILKSNSISLKSIDGQKSYLWNTGSTSAQINVTKAGKYFVKMTDSTGCVIIPKPISVVSGCFDASKKLINESTNIKICKGDQIEIPAIKAASYQWSTGKSSQSIYVEFSGLYTLTATDFCDNKKTDSIFVEAISIIWNVKNDTVKKGEKAILTSNKKETIWYNANDKNTPIFIGDTLKTSPLDVTSNYFAKTSEIIDFKSATVGEKAFPNTDFYGSNSTAGGLVFNVEKPCIIRSVVVNTDTKGKRLILITDKEGKLIFSKDFVLNAGINRLILNATLKPGVQYKMITDEKININELGYKSPRLVRTFNNTAFPYDINDVITIASSTFGAVYYYYFYDWEIEYDQVECTSELREVIAYVETSSSIQSSEDIEGMTLFPNPADDQIFIKRAALNDPAVVTISDTQGKIHIRSELKNQYINLSLLAKGLYIVTVNTAKGIKTFRLFKI